MSNLGKLLAQEAAAAEKKLRMRRFTWRRKYQIGPFMHADDKRLRLVARRSAVPLYLVEAFVDRLDDFANTNRPRGSLEGFSIEALAAYWSMPSDDQLGRIYAALEQPDIAWIDQDHIVDFWDRNPDSEDTTVAARQERSRLFKQAFGYVAKLCRDGLIDQGTRNEKEIALHALRDRARSGALVAWRDELRTILMLSTPAEAQLSTGDDPSQRDFVTVTTRSDHRDSRDPVEKTAAAAADGAAAGLGKDEQPDSPAQESPACVENPNDGVADEARAELWLASAGRQLVVERLTVVPNRAATLIERWLARAGGSHVALAEIVAAVAAKTKGPAHFDLAIGEACDRHQRVLERGPTLAMGPAGAAAKSIAAPPASAAREEPPQRKKAAGHG